MAFIEPMHHDKDIFFLHCEFEIRSVLKFVIVLSYQITGFVVNYGISNTYVLEIP